MCLKASVSIQNRNLYVYKERYWVGKLVQQFSVYCSCRGLSLVPSTHIKWLAIVYGSSLRDLLPLDTHTTEF